MSYWASTVGIAGLVSCGQTAFFSLSLGREKKGLEQFESHLTLPGSVTQQNMMHTQIVATFVHQLQVRIYIFLEFAID